MPLREEALITGITGQDGSYLAELLLRLSLHSGELVWDTTKPDGQPRRMLDISKALREFGWKARIGFEDGLRETIAWFEQNRTA